MSEYLKNILSVEFPKDKPWLIIGKGPSYSRISTVNLADFYTIGLNHVCQLQQVDYGHRTDYWGFPDYFDYNCRMGFIVPYYPHVNYKPSSMTVYDLLERDAVAIQLAEAGKLFWYSSSKKPHKVSTKIQVKYFSSEAAFHILCLQGIKDIYTIGIDSGKAYAKEFAHIQMPLRNGQSGFAKQWIQLTKLKERYCVKLTRI